MPFNIDWDPMHSPVSQWIVSHAATAVVAAVATNPQQITSMVPAQYQGLATALLGVIAGLLAKTSYGTVLNTTPPTK